MNNLKRRILHLLYPTKCPVCGEIIGYMEDFCDKCKENLTPYTENFIIDGAESFTAAYTYDDKISPAIMLLKDGICGNAAFALGKALAEALERKGITDKSDLILPVPLHRTSRRRRGFNQSELIAHEICLRFETPLCSNILIKHKRTAEQKNLSRNERLVNLSGAFSVTRPELIRGKCILLVDDVCTTGSTLSEIARLLKENGAAEVHCAACCKTPPPKENLKNEV